MLLNLTSNAVKYNRDGGSISLTCHGGEDGRIRIAVTDTGPGIPADKLPRLFTQFDRLGAEHSEVQGTGMGLVLAKRLAEAMGGALTVDSVEGQGNHLHPRALPGHGARLINQLVLASVMDAKVSCLTSTG